MKKEQEKEATVGEEMPPLLQVVVVAATLQLLRQNECRKIHKRPTLASEAVNSNVGTAGRLDWSPLVVGLNRLVVVLL